VPKRPAAGMRRTRTVARLLRSREPSIRWKTRVGVLGEDPDSPSLRRLAAEIRASPRSRRLAEDRSRPGRTTLPGVYHKWLGCHWALAALADLGYPGPDPALAPAMERAVALWLRRPYFAPSRPPRAGTAQRPGSAVPRIHGRYRRCASQQGNALFYATTLKMAPESADRLAERLVTWQWPDGGWNCDLDPSADTSSFAETLTPMLALFVYGKARRRPEYVAAARRASEVFLQRRLFRRRSDGAVIRPDFVRLHYPLYWHYDILGALKVLARMGQVRDPRCAEALDRLEAKERAGGGWAPDGRFYDHGREPARRGTDRVRWGPTDGRFNEWVTVDALTVLSAAGRA
jgi:hypothetical protein